MNELAWRKFPVNTIRNEDLDYISFLLPKELAAAPYMFYMTAICKCDDDGVFDIEDGVIFSRMMRIGGPGDVLNIANYMTQRRIITQVIPDQTLFMFSDWEAPDRRGAIKSKTAEERRAIIAQKIEAERRQKLQNANNMVFTKQTEPQFNTQPKAPEYPAPFFAAPEFPKMQPVQSANNPFFCAENDKNQKSVETIERERENKEIRKETHTENTESWREEREAAAASGPIEGPTATPAEEKTQEKQKIETQENFPNENSNDFSSNLAEQAIQINYEEQRSGLSVQEAQELKRIAEEFFVRNSLIFNPDADQHAIIALCNRIYDLSSKKNPAEIIMKTILQQFKLRATTRGDYFYQCPITPQFLLSVNTWRHMLQKASALLLSKNEDKKAWIDQMNYEINPEDQKAIDDDIVSQCLKYGIDPNDPQRAGKLMVEVAKDTG